MPTLLLNHGGTETALAIIHTFKGSVDSVAASLRYQSQTAGTAWEGASYERVLEYLEDIQRQLQAILNESDTARGDIGNGQEHARHDEREAERREAERREAEQQEREAQHAQS